MIEQSATTQYDTSLIDEYQVLEEQWSKNNEYLTNLKKGCFDDTAEQLLKTIEDLNERIEKHELRMKQLHQQIDVFEDDNDFIKIYQEKNVDKDTICFSVLETVSGFKNDFIQYHQNIQEILNLEPLVNGLKKQMDEKEKIKRYLFDCQFSESKFSKFVSEYLKENKDQKVSKWSQLKMVISGQDFILGFPEDVYYKYKKILKEHYEKSDEEYWSLHREYNKKHNAYKYIKLNQQVLCEKGGFLQKIAEKKNSKGVVVFTARDYVNGFRKKALAYKGLVDQKNNEQEKYANTLDALKDVESKLHIRQSEIEVLYASLIDEMALKVANLATQKRSAFKKWSENKSQENHPDFVPKNLFKI